jgi:hypothetical protein
MIPVSSIPFVRRVLEYDFRRYTFENNLHTRTNKQSKLKTKEWLNYKVTPGAVGSTWCCSTMHRHWCWGTVNSTQPQGVFFLVELLGHYLVSILHMHVPRFAWWTEGGRGAVPCPRLSYCVLRWKLISYLVSSKLEYNTIKLVPFISYLVF